MPPPSAIVPALLAWIARGRRDLPWRRRRDPYAVWISEVMLQQTQVATVVPYFERWLARFPDVTTLAAAPLDDVLKAWEGLGYYARGRNLQRAAQQIVAQHGGQIPSVRNALLALPGIGRYTAGAILSLAFGQAEPVLDGNVKRVLCRLFDIADDPREAGTEKRLWEWATALVRDAPDGAAGDLNEALMELGALVCVPAAPDCPVCPLADLCLAHVRGVERERPVKVVKARTPHYDVTAAVIADEAGRYLIVQRPPEGLLGGLWGFPGSAAGECGSDETAADHAITPRQVGDSGVPDLSGASSPLADCLAAALRDSLSIEVAVGAALLPIQHAYTHFRITLHPFRCQLLGGAPQGGRYTACRWVSPVDLEDYTFPVTDRKIIRSLLHAE
ncbi:MAG: A/G-specific adenine glycosylase [Chloroflexi bacterium]|nr:A/G-specific adenine glycosylase [Chloroflexota bacterium]